MRTFLKVSAGSREHWLNGLLLAVLLLIGHKSCAAQMSAHTTTDSFLDSGQINENEANNFFSDQTYSLHIIDESSQQTDLNMERCLNIKNAKLTWRTSQGRMIETSPGQWGDGLSGPAVLNNGEQTLTLLSVHIQVKNICHDNELVLPDNKPVLPIVGIKNSSLPPGEQNVIFFFQSSQSIVPILECAVTLPDEINFNQVNTGETRHNTIKMSDILGQGEVTFSSPKMDAQGNLYLGESDSYVEAQGQTQKPWKVQVSRNQDPAQLDLALHAGQKTGEYHSVLTATLTCQ